MRLLLLVFCLGCAQLVSAQAPPPPGPPPGPSQEIVLDAPTRQEVIENVCRTLNENYVYPELAKKMESALRERMARGEYDKITHPVEFAIKITNHLVEVCHDRHLRLNFSQSRIPPPGSNATPQVEERARYRAERARRNFGFLKVELLEGNVGYLDLRSFDDPELAGETAASTLNFLQNTDALIVDLRQNGGGDPAMITLLCSYFFDKRTHLNDIYWRPKDSTQEFWTVDSLAGKRYVDKPILVLTSKQTFSGGEEFAYDLKALKRATIIGEKTGGGSHPTIGKRISDHFMMAVPAGRAINPITKTDWEGAGVQPDLEVRAIDALRIGHKAAVEKLSKQTSNPANKQDLEDLGAELEAAGRPLPTDAGGIELPTTPAGRGLRGYLLAVNSGDIGQIRRYLRGQDLPVFFARADYRTAQSSGGFKVHSVMLSTDYRIEVLAQRKTDNVWVKVTLRTATDEPHHVRTVGIDPAEPPRN